MRDPIISLARTDHSSSPATSRKNPGVHRCGLGRKSDGVIGLPWTLCSGRKRQGSGRESGSTERQICKMRGKTELHLQLADVGDEFVDSYRWACFMSAGPLTRPAAACSHMGQIYKSSNSPYQQDQQASRLRAHKIMELSQDILALFLLFLLSMSLLPFPFLSSDTRCRIDLFTSVGIPTCYSRRSKGAGRQTNSQHNALAHHLSETHLPSQKGTKGIQIPKEE
ncbi:hypothetical protein V8C35DRAFT_308052 [Trichoderma chlorosporum]